MYRSRSKILMVLCIGGPLLLGAPPVEAVLLSQVKQSCDCLKAIPEASKRAGVPAEILRSIAQVESGIKGKPSPWAISQGGKANYHQDPRRALKELNLLIKQGETNFDVGCMQLNWRWHGHNFKSPALALNSKTNVLYAAYYLKQLRREFGSWSKAVRAYHSRNSKLSTPYLLKVAAYLPEKDKA